MNGPLLAIALMVFGLTWLTFYHADHGVQEAKRHGWERLAAIEAGGATFALVLAMAGVFTQLWTDASEGVGLFLLLVVTVAAGVFGYFTIARGQAHHRRSTLALGVIAGGAAALDFGGFVAIRANAGKYLSSAGKGITTHAGHVGATHGHHAAGSSGALGVILILAALVILVAIVIRKHRSGEVRNVARALPAGGGARGGGRGGARGASGALAFGDDT